VVFSARDQPRRRRDNLSPAARDDVDTDGAESSGKITRTNPASESNANICARSFGSPAKRAISSGLNMLS
jgi:hypothetical protein